MKLIPNTLFQQAQINEIINSNAHGKIESNETKLLRKEVDRLETELRSARSEVSSSKAAVLTKNRLVNEVAALQAQLKEYKTMNDAMQAQNDKLRDALALSEGRGLQEEPQPSQPRPKIDKNLQSKEEKPMACQNKSAEPTRSRASRLPVDYRGLSEGLDDADGMAQPPIHDPSSPYKQPLVTEDHNCDADAATPEVISVKCQAGSTKHAVVGQKSNFSITPFLNKTGNMYESLDSESEEDIAVRPPVTKKPAHAFEESPVSKKQHTRVSLSRAMLSTKETQTKPKKHILGATALSDMNKQSQSQLSEKRASPELADTHSQSRPASFADEQSTEKDVKPMTTIAPENKKRKRMVFGAGLRVGNNDEEEQSRQTSRQSMKRMPKLSSAMASALSVEGSSFSPLKRDRRGRSTSFLM